MTREIVIKATDSTSELNITGRYLDPHITIRDVKDNETIYIHTSRLKDVIYALISAL